MSAQILKFAKGKTKEKIEQAVQRLFDAVLFEELQNCSTIAEMLELQERLINILKERQQNTVKEFRKKFCGIPCDCCRENGNCQIGVYAARRRH